MSFDVLFITFLLAENGKSKCSLCSSLGYYSMSTSSKTPYLLFSL